MQISVEATEQVRNSILVTGAARSGTTIMGKVLHSFQSVEYAFEPPLLFALIPLIEDIPRSAWKLLFETYLYKDFLVPALAGRNINLNQHDDSCIIKVKSEAEIAVRFEKSWRTEELEKNETKKKRIAYKIPDILSYLHIIRKYYPEMAVIVMVRNPFHVVNSLYNKHWFAEKNMGKGIIWPFVMYRDISIPFWVKNEDFDNWIRLSEIERCAYYIKRQYESLEKNNNLLYVYYDEWIVQPQKTIEVICDRLGLNFGEKTQGILADVGMQKVRVNEEEIQNLSREIREDLSQLHDKCISLKI